MTSDHRLRRPRAYRITVQVLTRRGPECSRSSSRQSKWNTSRRTKHSVGFRVMLARSRLYRAHLSEKYGETSSGVTDIQSQLQVAHQPVQQGNYPQHPLASLLYTSRSVAVGASGTLAILQVSGDQQAPLKGYWPQVLTSPTASSGHAT